MCVSKSPQNIHFLPIGKFFMERGRASTLTVRFFNSIKPVNFKYRFTSEKAIRIFEIVRWVSKFLKIGYANGGSSLVHEEI